MGAAAADTFTLNSGEEDQAIIRGYRRNICKTVVTWLLIIVSGGTLRLVFHWMQHWMLLAMCSPCKLEDADHILVMDQWKQKFVCKVKYLTKESVTKTDLKHTGVDQNISLQQISIGYPTKNGEFRDVESIRYFDDREVRYVWNVETRVFQKLNGLDYDLDMTRIHASKPLSRLETLRRILLFRSNVIQISITPILEVMMKEVLNPFYIFQLFSVALWIYIVYYVYAGAILVMSIGSLTLTVIEIRQMEQRLRDRIHGQEQVEVCRPNGTTEIIQSDALVPGDFIIIPAQGCEVMCDAVLLTGCVIVNESALTGESVPVVKTSLPEGLGQFNIKADQRHVLFCGTKILQTRYYANEPVKALVLRTGFSTSKGALIRSIMFPKPVDFRFYRHTYYFVVLLAGVALCGSIYSIVLRIQRGQDLGELVVRSLDVFTIAVPPALPAALSVGVMYAQRRLRNAKIFCLSPRAINICGSINLVCFDKTGTLTEDGLDLKCVVPCSLANFEESVEDPSTLVDSTIRACMAACHSLTIIQGKLSGDPVDLIMFNAAKFTLEESDVSEPSRFDLVAPTVVTSTALPGFEKTQSIGIIKDFPFESSLQRMGTIVRCLGDTYFSYYVKGAPEKIITLCRHDTIPDDFQEQLEGFTRRGDRVLAVAWKNLQEMNVVRIHKVTREELDNNLEFLGFVVMENRLKHDTNAVLGELHRAEIRTVMITGDNMHTAISVARECGMVSEQDHVQVVTGKPDKVSWLHAGQSKLPQSKLPVPLNRYQSADSHISPSGATVVHLPRTHMAMNGESFEAIKNHHPQELKRILAEGTIFARMSPTDKEHLIEEFRKVGYYVAMCGDGANDCGALKAAHTGVSLSESEAAAAAPFTACTGSINCIPEIVKEGRAALVTSFGIFKYMAGYSLTQFFGIIVLYSIGTNFSENQFLYVDVFQVLILSALFGRSKAHGRLAKTPPPTSLIAFVPLFSVFSQVAIVCGVQLAAFFSAYSVKDDTSFENLYSHLDLPDGEMPYESKENFAVFATSSFQYVWLAIAFSKGPPYRRILFQNKLFCLAALIMIGFDLFLLLGPTEDMKWLLKLLPPSTWEPKLILLAIVAGNGIISLVFEKLIVDNLIYQRLGKRFKRLRNTQRHKDVTKTLLRDVTDGSWNRLEESYKLSPPQGILKNKSHPELAQLGIQKNSYTNNGCVPEQDTHL